MIGKNKQFIYKADIKLR